MSIFKILGKYKEHGIEVKINLKKYTEKKSETTLKIEDYFSFKLQNKERLRILKNVMQL